MNAVAPGGTATEGAAVLMKDIDPEQAKAMIASIPMGRIGQPKDIAQSVLFLASEDSSWITGERITASGGQR